MNSTSRSDESETEALRMGRASHDYAEYYRAEFEQRTVDYLCFGGSVSARPTDIPPDEHYHEGLRGYDLWMIDRFGPGVEPVRYEDTAFYERDKASPIREVKDRGV